MMTFDTDLKMEGLSELKTRNTMIKMLEFLSVEYEKILRVNANSKHWMSDIESPATE